MQKYLYLTKAEWTEPWIRGGKIPLKVASTYLSLERAGTLTPDENLIHEGPYPAESIYNWLGLKGKIPDSFLFRGNTSNGRALPDAERRFEDGFVLCLCNSLNQLVCKQLGKSACVRILNVEKLKAVLDAQMGKIGAAGSCRYTKSHQRNHFLKSEADQWQDEYRIFWPLDESDELDDRWVDLPEGMADIAQMDQE